MGKRSEANPYSNTRTAADRKDCLYINENQNKHRQVVADFLQRIPNQGWASEAKPIPTPTKEENKSEQTQQNYSYHLSHFTSKKHTTMEKEELKDIEFMLCDCESIEHQITLRKDNELKDIYMTIHLKPLPWHKRIVNGIKYIFGYRCAYGDFDEFILSHKHADTLRKMADFLSKE